MRVVILLSKFSTWTRLASSGKKMPEKTYISRKEKTMPGFKAAKDWLTLMLGGNALGDFKLKPLLVYRADNPREWKNINKSQLPVIWKSNKKVWVTLIVFKDWFFHHFIPEVKLYCQENDIPFKILLILDNAPGHPPYLDDLDPDVKAVYLPPNTTSLLQPMDQGVIANFKKYYIRRTYRQVLKAVEEDPNMTLSGFWKSFNIYMCIKHINADWHEVAQTNMNGVWKALCPQFVNNAEGFDQEEAKKILENLVEIFNKLDIDLEEEDFEELLESHSQQELTNEDLMELESTQGLEEEDENEEILPVKKSETKLMAEGFSLIEKALTIFESQDANVERFSKVAMSVRDSFQCYRIIYDEKKNKTVQTSLHQFFELMPSTPLLSSSNAASHSDGPL